MTRAQIDSRPSVCFSLLSFPLQHFNLDSDQRKNTLQDVGTRYCTPAHAVGSTPTAPTTQADHHPTCSMMALPSTPTASTTLPSSSRLGNLFRKIRTPSPEQSRGPLAALNNAFSTPGGPRRSPSRASSFATTNSSTTSVNSLSPSVLEMPQFEAGDWLNSDWTPAELSDGSSVPLFRNPYSSNLPAPTTTSLLSSTSSTADENTLAQPARPSSALSRHSPPPRAGSSLSRNTGASASGSSYYTSTGSGSGSSAGGQASGVDSSGDKVRGGKPSFLIRSVNGSEGGIKTLTKGWAKSREFLGRSGGAEKKGAVLSEELEKGAAADEMGVKKETDVRTLSLYL